MPRPSLTFAAATFAPTTFATAPIAAALVAAALAQPASAHIADSWPRIARSADPDAGCALTVSGNGQAYRIAADGFAPGGRARLLLANADMPPIDRSVAIDGAGGWSDYYLPFLWNHAGGTVTVSVQSPGCSLTVDFPWTRAAPVAR